MEPLRVPLPLIHRKVGNQLSFLMNDADKVWRVAFLI